MAENKKDTTNQAKDTTNQANAPESPAQAADEFRNAADRARQFHETMLENARTTFQQPMEQAGQEAVGRYVDWLDNVAKEQRRFAESDEVKRIEGVRAMLNAQADFTGEFAKSLRNLTK